MKAIKVRHEQIPIGAYVSVSFSNRLYQVTSYDELGTLTLHSCSISPSKLSTYRNELRLVKTPPTYKVGQQVSIIHNNEGYFIIEIYKDEPKYALATHPGAYMATHRLATTEIYLPCK
jgi:hypothetical protein